ncbi:hypothetical protein AVEN_122182-1 [Araneus ventricosus]|uniref:Uncharacterized protein n=1 Tax=Araneus ventricosus TaxID=182803 RepID=A0A4Y2IGD2_ARAVE|nr:hypothetical protein AVEN_122182-1 [Araneus ventricosus]
MWLQCHDVMLLHLGLFTGGHHECVVKRRGKLSTSSEGPDHSTPNTEAYERTQPLQRGQLKDQPSWPMASQPKRDPGRRGRRESDIPVHQLERTDGHRWNIDPFGNHTFKARFMDLKEGGNYKQRNGIEKRSYVNGFPFTTSI